MIVQFNPDLFVSEDVNIQSKTSKIILEILEDKFLWDIDNLDELFLADDVNNFKMPFNEKWISIGDKEKLRDKINEIYSISAYITPEHHHYLTTIRIGINNDEIHPSDAYKIINERSIVIIENYPNDWKFIKSLIEKYEHFARRKSIYQLIKKALDNRYLFYDHAGGSGIQKQIQGWKESVYQNIYQYKLIAIFDSDKKHPTDFKGEYKNLIQYIKNRSIDTPPSRNDIIYDDTDIIVWHMLHKRAIENYVPLNVINENITNLNDNQKENLDQLDKTPEIMDFIVYYKPTGQPTDYYISIGKDKVKEQFPEMFLTNFLPSELEDRCNHHKVSIKLPNGTTEQVSEIEQILLKIAKII
ncbi:MAG: hypothetical protein V7L14_18935 [Nostoc sp.]|uniref:hypothetical protein n=1 Tax=Nostoc sp. TaxID=1180 RepID=UPI002FF5CD5B